MDSLGTTTAANRGSTNHNQQANFNMVSGIGQYHTNEPGKPNPTPYFAIGLEGIRALVDNPQQVDKTQGQWFIPSTLLSRSFKAQEQSGQYLMLWADLDNKPPAQETLAVYITLLIHDVNYEIYSSRSATADNMKCRVLIPLARPLVYADWWLAQSVLNDWLEMFGVIPDRANERAAQLCYLPNRGAFYKSTHNRSGQSFDPLEMWCVELAFKREKMEAERVAAETEKQAATAKRAALDLSGTPDVITAFILNYPVEEILVNGGYEQRGDSFRHPKSESGSYSATVKDGRVNALSPNDPLYTDGKGAHSAFSAFTTLFHGGDISAAMKYAGDNLLFIDGVPYNKVKQIGWAKTRALENYFTTNANTPMANGTPFSLAKFALNGKSDDMEKKMLNDKYIMGKIAILGQATVIYAKPNTGKTLLVLRLLIDAIGAENINPEDIFYINADDNSKGLVTKLKLAEAHKFHMLAPGHEGLKSADLIPHMQTMIAEGSASGKVMVLDTLKKFTDLMDKKVATAFMRTGREFVSNGGSLILLAHTNKHRNAEGSVVFGGTSDIVDDVDCAYTLDEVNVSGLTKTVLFANFKSRGDVEREVAYTYSTVPGQSYVELLDSIKILNSESAERLKIGKSTNDELLKNAEAIKAIVEAIEAGSGAKTEMLKAASKNCGISIKRLSEILTRHTGTSYSSGHRWQEIPGDKHTKNYIVLPES